MKKDHCSFLGNSYSWCFKGMQEKGLKEEQLEDYMQSKYKLKTIIPEGRYHGHIHSYELTQKELNEFLEHYKEYEEFLISLRKIKKEE